MKDIECDPIKDHYVNGMKRLIIISKRSETRVPDSVSDDPDSPRVEGTFLCLVCGYIWDKRPNTESRPKRCPACSSIRWNNIELKRHKCKQCSHRWMSNTDDPIMCPSCRSKLWNKDVGKFMCRDCGNIWNYKSEGPPPKRCPVCRSCRLTPDIIECMCKRCGYSGKMDATRKNRCPICKTTLSIYEGASKCHGRRTADRSARNDVSTGLYNNPGIRSILMSESDSTRKIVELVNRTNIDFPDAEILVRYAGGEDLVTIARATDASLNQVIMMTSPLSKEKEKVPR